MNGIAKDSAAQKTIHVEHAPLPQKTADNNQVDTPLSFEGVPVDLYRYFSLDIANAPQGKVEKMQAIYQALQGETMGDKISKLREYENRIGMSGVDSRIDKLYNYLKLSRQSEEIVKKMKAMEDRGGNW